MDLPDWLCRVPRLDSAVLPCLVSLTIPYLFLYSSALCRIMFPNFLRKIVCLFYLQQVNKIGTHPRSVQRAEGVEPSVMVRLTKFQSLNVSSSLAG